MALIDKLLKMDFLAPVMTYIYAMSEAEIRIVVIVTFLLVLLLVYRLFGVPAAIVLGVLFFLVYLVWINNTFDSMEKRESEINERMQRYQDEIDKFETNGESSEQK